jgi:hypothetical protein
MRGGGITWREEIQPDVEHMEGDPAQNVALLAAAMFGSTRSFVQEGSQSLNMMGVRFFSLHGYVGFTDCQVLFG